MAELVYAQHLKCCEETHAGSTPAPSTTIQASSNAIHPFSLFFQKAPMPLRAFFVFLIYTLLLFW